MLNRTVKPSPRLPIGLTTVIHSRMKWTEFFIPTTKETPTDAVVPSHQLMIRAGLVRQVVAGAYTYLPLGYRSLRKIEAIVREEMNAAGGIERRRRHRT